MEANSSEYIKQAAVKDETFHTSNAGHYILHINLDGHSGLSFSIYDSPRNKFIVLESYISRKKCADIQEFMFFLKSLISQHSELTKHKFKEIHLSISHAASTFVPSALFVEEDKEKYFLMNQDMHLH